MGRAVSMVGHCPSASPTCLGAALRAMGSWVPPITTFLHLLKSCRGLRQAERQQHGDRACCVPSGEWLALSGPVFPWGPRDPGCASFSYTCLLFPHLGSTGPTDAACDGAYQLERIRQRHPGEEVGDKVGTAVPVIEVRVGHQRGPDGGAHKLLQGERTCQGPMHRRDVCNPMPTEASNAWETLVSRSMPGLRTLGGRAAPDWKGAAQIWHAAAISGAGPVMGGAHHVIGTGTEQVYSGSRLGGLREFLPPFPRLPVEETEAQRGQGSYPR